MRIAPFAIATASAVALYAPLAAPATAADLRGSIKDYGYTAPMPVIHRSAAGPCYIRGDVGGVIGITPDGRWPVTNYSVADDVADGGDGDGIVDDGEIVYTYEGDQIRPASIENTWLAEIGAGCGSGSRGFRGEITFGFRGKQDYDGEPRVFTGPPPRVGDPVGTPPDYEDPIHTSIQSHTVMLNAYYDFGQFRGFVPYVGAGIGAAYHEVDEVYFTENPALTNRIEGNENVSLAWAVMAGVGYQISDRAILDVGYRYIDMGDAKSGRIDDAGFKNPAVKFEDIRAHEIKVGLRYHFGGSREPEYVPLK